MHENRPAEFFAQFESQTIAQHLCDPKLTGAVIDNSKIDSGSTKEEAPGLDRFARTPWPIACLLGHRFDWLGQIAFGTSEARRCQVKRPEIRFF